MTLRKSLSWSLGQQGGMMVLQVVNMMVIARLLTPEEIGIFVIAVSVMIMVQALRAMGLGQYLIRDPELRDETIRSVFGMSIALCCVLSALLLWLRQSVAEWMNAPEIADILLLTALTILIFPIEQTAAALLKRKMHFDVLAKATLMARTLNVAISIGLALWGMSTMALVWGMIAEIMLRTSLLGMAEARHLRLGPSVRGWKPLMGFGVWTTGASLAGQGLVEGNKLLVGGLLGVGTVAIFDRAGRIPGLVRKGLFAPLGNVMLPAFAEDLRQGRDIGPKVARLTAITTGIVWPGFAVIAILSQEVVLLALGPQWNQAAVILPWLLMAQAVPSLLPQPEHLLVPFGNVRRLMFLRVFQMIMGLGISFTTLHWGLETFAMFRPVNALLAAVLTWWALIPYLGTSVATLLRGHAKSALMALMAAVPVAAWKFVGLGGGSYLVLAPLLVVSATLGLGMAVLVRHPLADEIQRTFRWLRERPRLT